MWVRLPRPAPPLFITTRLPQQPFVIQLREARGRKLTARIKKRNELVCNALGSSLTTSMREDSLCIFSGERKAAMKKAAMKWFVFSSIVSVALLVASAPLSAHHGNAAYDATKEVTLTGVVTEWIVANPHSLLKFDATDDKGTVVHWVVESGAASVNQARGVRLTKQLLKPGDKVTVTMMVAKNGQPVGRIHRLVLPDGRLMVNDLP